MLDAPGADRDRSCAEGDENHTGGDTAVPEEIAHRGDSFLALVSCAQFEFGRTCLRHRWRAVEAVAGFPHGDRGKPLDAYYRSTASASIAPAPAKRTGATLRATSPSPKACGTSSIATSASIAPAAKAKEAGSRPADVLDDEERSDGADRLRSARQDCRPELTRPAEAGQLHRQSRCSSPRECSGGRSRGSRRGSGLRGPMRRRCRSRAPPAGCARAGPRRRAPRAARSSHAARRHARRDSQEQRSRSRGAGARRRRTRRSPTAVDPSSSAGLRSPTIDATVIAPIAVPSRIGRRASARAPMKKTGTAPNPVASAVALAASVRRTTSMPVVFYATLVCTAGRCFATRTGTCACCTTARETLPSSAPARAP